MSAAGAPIQPPVRLEEARCPSHSAMSVTGTPLESPADAKKWRSQCGVIFRGIPASQSGSRPLWAR